MVKRPTPPRSAQSADSLFRDEFLRLVDEWNRDRPHGVDVADVAEHPAYQGIIAMGEGVIPLRLAELERKPQHWFWALHVLTGADPVPPASRGKIKEMAAAWLRWGRRQGYRW